MSKAGDLRMLGAADGYAHALVYLRMGHIGPIDGSYSPSIHPRHVRRIAAKKAKLKPLREIEKWLMQCHREVMDAYKKTEV